MLKKAGHRILWLDAIGENLSEEESRKTLFDFEPELIVLETKTPVIKKHWEYINNVKCQMPGAKFILLGDHVSYYPEESLRNSKVDFVLTGGDYDFLLVNLVKHLTKEEKLEGGIWRRDKNGKVKSSGPLNLNHNLDQTPIVDYDLTKWYLYKEADFYQPSVRMMFGRGCAGAGGKPGVCTFCSWQHILWQLTARLRSPQHVANEVEHLIKNYKLKEIFDDTESGPCFNKEWFRNFYQELKKRNLLGKIVFSSNARADTLDKNTCGLLEKLGFRMLKIGIESGNNKTLKRIAKDESVEKIIWGVKNAKDAGLVTHLSVMIGFPWEDEKDVKKTYEITKELLLYKTRVGDSLQASMIIPYPGTPLYYQALKNKWFLINPKDYEAFDMGNPVLKSKVNPKAFCQKFWRLHLHPTFVLRSFWTVRKTDDLNLLLRGFFSFLGHQRD